MSERNDIISKLFDRIENPLVAAMFMYLIYLSDEEGVVRESYSDIAKAFSINKQKVFRIISVLRECYGIVTEDNPITVLNIEYYKGFTHTDVTNVLRKRYDKNTKKKVEADEEYTDDTKMNEVIREWLAYKKEKKQTYKPIGLRTLIKKLVKLSGGDADVARQIVEQSIMNNYSGLFELKTESGNKNGNFISYSDKRMQDMDESFKNIL